MPNKPIISSEIIFEGTKTFKQILEEMVHYVNIKDSELAYRSRDGQAELKISKEKASLVADTSKGVTVNRNSTTITGPVHLAGNPHDIKISGYWIFNDELLTCLPSTLYTPIPVLKFKEPEIAKQISDFAEIDSSI